MLCDKCGSEIFDDDIFCGDCGWKVTQAAPAPTDEPLEEESNAEVQGDEFSASIEQINKPVDVQPVDEAHPIRWPTEDEHSRHAMSKGSYRASVDGRININADSLKRLLDNIAKTDAMIAFSAFLDEFADSLSKLLAKVPFIKSVARYGSEMFFVSVAVLLISTFSAVPSLITSLNEYVILMAVLFAVAKKNYRIPALALSAKLAILVYDYISLYEMFGYEYRLAERIIDMAVFLVFIVAFFIKDKQRREETEDQR